MIRALVLVAVLPTLALADEWATTDRGKRVILKDDRTWVEGNTGTTGGDKGGVLSGTAGGNDPGCPDGYKLIDSTVHTIQVQGKICMTAVVWLLNNASPQAAFMLGNTDQVAGSDGILYLNGLQEPILRRLAMGCTYQRLCRTTILGEVREQRLNWLGVQAHGLVWQ
jgi:hypothetical protein